MKISLYTQADFGKKRNLKTNEAESIIKACNPEVVYCRDFEFDEETELQEKYVRIIPGGSLIPKFLTAINFLTGSVFKLNRNQQRILDICASERDNITDIAIMHPYIFKNTIKELKNKWTITDTVTINVVTSLPSNMDEATNSDYIIVYASVIKDELVKAGYDEDRIYVANLGVDVRKYTPGKNKEKFIVLCVADFSTVKGLKYLLKAWKEADVDGELHLVGNKTKDAWNELRKYDYDNRIKNIPHTDPVPYYQKASVFVLPSLSEGWGNVVGEAMSAKLPVIVTDKVGAKDAVVNNKTGFIVASRNVREIRDKILHYYNYPKDIIKHGTLGQKHIQKFTWEHFEKNFKKIIDDIKERECL